MRLCELAERQRLLVLVGPGGVGKTTLAAAVGAHAARQGRRVLVLTIDPARRLAGVLGLDGLHDEVSRVPDPESRLRGELWAAMLDTQRSFDALIARIAGSADSRERILANPIYRAFSRSLARSHAYVAMERLYDVAQAEHGFDLVVLDTPPLRSAIEILDAPGRLSRFIDEGVARWFLAPERGPLRRLLPSGGRAVGRLLGVLASRKLVRELSEFFGVMLALSPGFRTRAQSLEAVLRAPTTSFALITSPQDTALADAEYLANGLAARGFQIDALVFNRAYVELAAASRPPAHHAEVSPQLGALQAELTSLIANQLRENSAALERSRDFARRLALKNPEKVADLAVEPATVGELCALCERHTSLL